MPFSCSPANVLPSTSSANARQKQSALASSFGAFVLSGGVCFVVGLCLLYTATSVLHIHYLASALGCSLLTGALGFALNRRFAFRERASKFWPELGRYYVVNSGSLALNLALMALLVSGFRVPYLAASVLLSLVMTGFNFFLHRNWSFGAR